MESNPCGAPSLIHLMAIEHSRGRKKVAIMDVTEGWGTEHTVVRFYENGLLARTVGWNDLTEEEKRELEHDH